MSHFGRSPKREDGASLLVALLCACVGAGVATFVTLQVATPNPVELAASEINQRSLTETSAPGGNHSIGQDDPIKVLQQQVMNVNSQLREEQQSRLELQNIIFELRDDVDLLAAKIVEVPLSSNGSEVEAIDQSLQSTEAELITGEDAVRDFPTEPGITLFEKSG